jgi:hypothetical protein
MFFSLEDQVGEHTIPSGAIVVAGLVSQICGNNLTTKILYDCFDVLRCSLKLLIQKWHYRRIIFLSISLF